MVRIHFPPAASLVRTGLRGLFAKLRASRLKLIGAVQHGDQVYRSNPLVRRSLSEIDQLAHHLRRSPKPSPPSPRATLVRLQREKLCSRRRRPSSSTGMPACGGTEISCCSIPSTATGFQSTRVEAVGSNRSSHRRRSTPARLAALLPLSDRRCRSPR